MLLNLNANSVMVDSALNFTAITTLNEVIIKKMVKLIVLFLLHSSDFCNKTNEPVY